MKYMSVAKHNHKINLEFRSTSEALLYSSITDSLPGYMINDTSKYYVIEFADGYDFTDIDNGEFASSVSTAQSLESLVTTFTVNHDSVNHNKKVDEETYELIKTWCKDQGKCEEYYLRVGLENGTSDSEFVAYKDSVSSIRTSQGIKKI